jgi:hypothetical protein
MGGNMASLSEMEALGSGLFHFVFPGFWVFLAIVWR